MYNVYSLKVVQRNTKYKSVVENNPKPQLPLAH